MEKELQRKKMEPKEDSEKPDVDSKKLIKHTHPEDDKDFESDVIFVPDIITKIRMSGGKIFLVKKGYLYSWYWLMPDNTKYYCLPPHERKD